ncbi:molybdenum cofactor guanylyltransferase [Desulfolucanica intricata]|uniref:molybdenum cofactor guanylyltransferase n=1 Tax=Desulfolucanica intricata TaxID=1285191 RepID=UPI000829CDB0|nr:molybdenum cofactor guanylyltransferase [Desulfolucanica intricata]
MINIAAVILAGGKSSRMGTDKAFLTLGEHKMIEYVLNELTIIFKNILIVSNQDEKFSNLGVPVVKDIIPNCGPLSGIHSGLINAKKDYIFVTGCDMPFISGSLIQYMIDKLKNGGFDVLIPKVGNYMEPLFAIYSKMCIKPIEKNLAFGKLKVLDFLPEVQVGYISKEEISSLVDLEKVFININTPKELVHARKLIPEYKKSNRCM